MHTSKHTSTTASLLPCPAHCSHLPPSSGSLLSCPIGSEGKLGVHELLWPRAASPLSHQWPRIAYQGLLHSSVVGTSVKSFQGSATAAGHSLSGSPCWSSPTSCTHCTLCSACSPTISPTTHWCSIPSSLPYAKPKICALRAEKLSASG